jgi:hypothetical protein
VTTSCVLRRRLCVAAASMCGRANRRTANTVFDSRGTLIDFEAQEWLPRTRPLVAKLQSAIILDMHNRASAKT